MNHQISSNRPIGVYDSGIGGITVLKALQAKLPHENFIYFADTAHLPYGNKSPTEIKRYSEEIITWLYQENNTKLVIAACHTSSALALETLSALLPIPVIGTIYPMIRSICHESEHKRIGIIATPASVASRMHENIFKAHGFRGKLMSIPCPDFVPLLEAPSINEQILLEKSSEYLRYFIEQGLTTLVYGCTHYPLLHSLLQKILPAHVQYIDPATLMAEEAYAILFSSNQLRSTQYPGETEFYASQHPERLAQKIAALTGQQEIFVTLQDLSATSVCPERVLLT